MTLTLVPKNSRKSRVSPDETNHHQVLDVTRVGLEVRHLIAGLGRVMRLSS